MYSNEKIYEILGYIEFAEKFKSGTFDRDLFLTELNKIKSIYDIERSSLLKPWESSLIYNLEGLQALKNKGKQKQNLSTYLIIHPSFINTHEVIERELSKLLLSRKDISVKKYAYKFTKELVVELYGGTPWFEPYTKLCTEMDVFNKESICYHILSSEKDCVLDLVDFKNKFRENFPALEVKMNFPDCQLPGKINPFHTPDSIENENHVKAIEKVLIGEVL